MKKRSCQRFNIPGTTLYYKIKPGLFIKHEYSDSYYPVLDFSRGGAKFLCNDRLKAGAGIFVKLNIPGIQESPELIASIRWISKNREQSYKYQTGIAFNSYGTGKKENTPENLALLIELEKRIVSSEGK